jgi:tripartite-type tricarboxylate transporter receptor subunit TctC
VQSQLTNLGFKAMSSTPHELETFLRQDIGRGAKVMDAAGIKE